MYKEKTRRIGQRPFLVGTKEVRYGCAGASTRAKPPPRRSRAPISPASMSLEFPLSGIFMQGPPLTGSRRVRHKAKRHGCAIPSPARRAIQLVLHTPQRLTRRCCALLAESQMKTASPVSVSCGIGRVGPISEGSASMARSYISLGFPAPTSVCSAYSILLPCRFVLVVPAASFLFFAVVVFNSFCPARKVVSYLSLLGLQAWRPCSLWTVGPEIWTREPGNASSDSDSRGSVCPLGHHTAMVGPCRCRLSRKRPSSGV